MLLAVHAPLNDIRIAAPLLPADPWLVPSAIASNTATDLPQSDFDPAELKRRLYFLSEKMGS